MFEIVPKDNWLQEIISLPLHTQESLFSLQSSSLRRIQNLEPSFIFLNYPDMLGSLLLSRLCQIIALETLCYQTCSGLRFRTAGSSRRPHMSQYHNFMEVNYSEDSLECEHFTQGPCSSESNNYGLQKNSNHNPGMSMKLKDNSKCPTSREQHTTSPSTIYQVSLGMENEKGPEKMQGSIPLENIPIEDNHSTYEMSGTPLNFMLSQDSKIMNHPQDKRKRTPLPKQNIAVGQDVYSTQNSESKRRKEEFIKTFGTQGRVSMSHPDSTVEWLKDSGVVLAGDNGISKSNLIENSPHTPFSKSLVEIQKRFGISESESSVSNISNTRRSGHYLVLLQKIGIINANRSPTLCYEIYDFFCGIYKNITGKNKCSQQEIDAIKLAAKHGGYTIVMSFLGVLRVFEGQQLGKEDMEVLLNDGWSFMKDFYSSWKTADLEDFAFGKLYRYSSDGALDPGFHLRYLKKINDSSNVPFSLVHALSLFWSKAKGQSKVPQDFDYWQESIDIFENDSKSIQGGLYERMGIKNYAFWGPEQFSRKNWYSYGEASMESDRIWHLASNAAQFHTPLGQNMCKELHSFFEDLIQRLKISYNSLNDPHPSLKLSVQSHKTLSEINANNLDLIFKAVGMAEYRVVVPFIGIIRILNRRNLTVEQLQKLMENAIKFLKDTFGKWEHLDFHPKNIQHLFKYKKNMFTPQNKLDDPGQMFQTLFGFSDKNRFPSRAILTLLRSWHSLAIKGDPSSPNYIQFPIEKIPSGTFLEWNSQVMKILKDNNSIDIY
ncbi:uncharacterized protein MELLADRAFT_62881 [Melampsora larici-populina 98AG31]|uniref:Uncharacterized protein n=1 Tax=Melampsora larici-populina (strain 98AG31 / pathotype 3-4-7) TaxID=747676 RepID=F4RKL1_MELLP|nr:uncharacterized protein MELLADRAFT_62881 [Melampsora larici-populina 98AG31]EGG07160.1 hypothetical protein MELLADRAFT_62881 [Melampsora larici-populina 98AG31]